MDDAPSTVTLYLDRARLVFLPFSRPAPRRAAPVRPAGRLPTCPHGIRRGRGPRTRGRVRSFSHGHRNNISCQSRRSSDDRSAGEAPGMPPTWQVAPGRGIAAGASCAAAESFEGHTDAVAVESTGSRTSLVAPANGSASVNLVDTYSAGSPLEPRLRLDPAGLHRLDRGRHSHARSGRRRARRTS